MSENQGNGILAGFVVGAVVGAGLALLLAPASGSDTRQRLRDKAVELGGKTAGPRRFMPTPRSAAAGVPGIPPRATIRQPRL